MVRYGQYGQQNDMEPADGDAGFAGVDGRADPRQLPPGICSFAKNHVFASGVAELRSSFNSAGWGEQAALSFPFDFLLAAAPSADNGGTGGTDNVNVSISKKTDRGVNEFQIGGLDRAASNVGISVGDWIEFEYVGPGTPRVGRWQVVYAADTVVRVEATDEQWGWSWTGQPGGATWEGTVDFDERRGLGKVWGAGVFSDPYGSEGVLVAGTDYTWLLRSGQLMQTIPYPEGVTIDDTVEFVQCFDRVVMLRGEVEVPLVWIPLVNFEAGLGEFEFIVEEGSGTGTFLEPIPNSISGTEFNGRLYVVYSRDQIAISDVYDYTHFDPVFQNFRINEGSDDSITSLLPFGEARMLVFFDQSIWLLNNVFGDLDTVRGDILTRERGAIAPHAIVQMGADVWFLSDGGIYSLSQTQDNQLQASAAPISAPIQPLMDRVNWSAADQAQAVSHSGKFYLAVPVDGSSYNNAMFVYDQVTQQWWGEWRSEVLDVFRMLRTDHALRREIVMVGGSNLDSDALDGSIIVHAGDFADEVYDQRSEIATELLTRGYSWGDLERRRAKEMAVQLSTWHPSFEISALVDGVGEERSLTGGSITKNRAKYTIFGKADYVTNNENLDHADPYREDYSVGLNVKSQGYAWLSVNINTAAANPEIFIFLFADYIDEQNEESLDTLTPGDVIVTTGNLAETLNRSWLVSRIAVADAGVYAACSISQAEKQAIVADCTPLYAIHNSFYFTTGGTNYIKNYDVSNSVDDAVLIGSEGVQFQAHQHVNRRLKLRAAGSYAQVRIENAQGRCNVHGLQVVGGDYKRRYGSGV